MRNISGFLSSLLSTISEFRYWGGRALSNPRMFVLFGLLAIIVMYFILAETTELALWWSFLTLAIAGFLWLIVFLWQRRKARKANDGLGEVLEAQARSGKSNAGKDLDPLRKRMLQAVQTIKTSKIGQASGNAALYELPWYIIIGNPAAGKSSAISHSGLQFPLADKTGTAIRGMGGTRNCDWFFTTEGILLDTAGRYSVHEDDRTEWLGFLDLLKRHRSKAPINGIVVAASINELIDAGPEFGIELAKNLRQRVQELTERLEVYAPVYIIFTKADLISGFNEFFADSDAAHRNHVWGATLPYNTDEERDVVALFDEHFDILHLGLKEISTAQIASRPKNALPPGLLTFPLEFAAIKPALRTFLATLFEKNPYQYKPVFRGFYFTSALQEGEAQSNSTPRLRDYFGLKSTGAATASAAISSQNGFFLKDLFSKVIFADKQLVRQHANPGKVRLRYAGFFAMVVALGLVLGGWSWSYFGNQQLAYNIQADLDTVVKMQADHTDLESRLDAMDILQDRIEQLDRFDAERPWALGFGMYQGDKLKARLLAEYYNGVRQFMLAPVKTSIEDFLGKVRLKPDANGLSAAKAFAASAQPEVDTLFQDASQNNTEDAYNALKAYLMMASHEHAEPSHLADQITRFWRGWLETNRGAMPRDKLIRSASRLVSFYASRSADPSWPEIKDNLSLVDATRRSLRSVMQGMPARERAYATIKARAATRFQSMTVARIVGDADAALVVGSYAVPGTFTRSAWFDYIEPAFVEASRKELQTNDWVLGVNTRDDLTLEGSPEQIFKSLSTMYKTEYAEEWKRFLRGVSIKPFPTFSQAIEGMNRLGNPQISPLRKLLVVADEQTVWDNPNAVQATQSKSKDDSPGWFKRVILRQGNGANAPAAKTPAQTAIGPIGQQFTDIARLVADHDGQSMLDSYMESLSRIRTRFNLVQNEGDPGPGALKLLRETLEGKGSELSESLRLVDEQILAELTDDQRQTLRPLLVRPLIQSYAAALQPAESELNKLWLAQVYQPYNDKLADKYPFNPQGSIEATSAEIGAIFGPEGSISHYVNEALASLTVRRGALLTSRTWGDMGISLRPVFTAGFSQWIAPLSGAAASNAQQAQTLFQIQPKPAGGASEYTIEIDGQQLRYRNTPPQWVNFVWPNSQGVPGVKISAVTFDGQTVNLLNEPGRYGLERMLASAKRVTNADGSFNLMWNKSGVKVPVILRIISNTQANSGNSANTGQGFKGLNLPKAIAGDTQGPVVQATQAGARP